MSDISQGDGWWVASDGKWYPPEQHPDYVAGDPVRSSDEVSAETIVVPAASAPPSHPGPTFTAPETQTYQGQPSAEPAYNLSAGEPEPSGKRNIILGIGSLVLVLGLGFLLFRFVGGGSAGGADSPEAALDQLIASVNERDAVGFVDVFDPDEIDAWFGSFAPAFAQFENVETNGDVNNEISEAYASIFNAFDYSLTGPRGGEVVYDVVPLDDNGRITRVRVEGLDLEVMVEDTDSAVIGAFGGDATGIDVQEFDGARLELRDEFDGLAARLFIPGESAADEFSPAHLDIVTVQKDGKWFVSLGYSVLEIARSAGEFDGSPSPDYGRAFELVDSQTGGSESPEAVVQDFFNSLEVLDYETIITLTDPYATPYLHDYQPLIDAEVDDEARREEVREASLRIDELELGTSEWEGRTVVTLGDVSAESSGGMITINTAEWCATIQDEFDRERVCAEEGIAELLQEAGSDLDPRDFVPQETGIIVVERNGRWYLDPLGTMGYFADQLAEVGVSLTNELNGNPASEFGDLFLVEGPVARQGVPATAQAESGAVGIALDLDDYPVVGGDFDEFHVAVARIVTDQPGTFVSYGDIPLEGEEWVVVYDSTRADPELPAIAANTDGELDVELFEATVTEVGLDGYSGQLGGQGRPQVFVVSDDAAFADFEIQGATAEGIFGWELNGVAYPESFGSSTFTSSSEFVVVSGEPGASFSISVEGPEPDPVPEPEPEPEPEPDDGSDTAGVELALAADFGLLVEEFGYSFDSTEPGGFFDGCGGPDDPDVTSHLYSAIDTSLMVVTPYPSFERAEAAFGDLQFVQTPCVAFEEIEINDIVIVTPEDIRIEWQLIDDPSSIVFEHYRLVGPTIVVATNGNLADLDDQLIILDNWFS